MVSTLPEVAVGIPAHDTFERVFPALDSRAFQRCCLAWFRAAAELEGIGHFAIDGKTLRGSAGAQLRPLHVVSAWATQAQLTLGPVAVDKKSNEITAIPQLLALLDLHGALVTIDAMGCQKEIAQKVVDGGGDYVLTVKGNQGHLLEDIQATLTRFFGAVAIVTECPRTEAAHLGSTRTSNCRSARMDLELVQPSTVSAEATPSDSPMPPPGGRRVHRSKLEILETLYTRKPWRHVTCPSLGASVDISRFLRVGRGQPH